MIDYIINPKIEWTIQDGKGPDKQAVGKWKGWNFSVTHNGRSGWNVKINGVQAWTHMRSFNDAMSSVKDRLRDWAYMDQFKEPAQ